MHWAIFTIGNGGLEYREPSSFSSRCGTRKTSKTKNHMRLMPSSSVILCCRLQMDMALRNNCVASERKWQNGVARRMPAVIAQAAVFQLGRSSHPTQPNLRNGYNALPAAAQPECTGHAPKCLS
jgi:hypothetical protein